MTFLPLEKSFLESLNIKVNPLGGPNAAAAAARRPGSEPLCRLSVSVRDVRKFKETKKHFDRVREDMEIAQVKNAQAPRNKPHEVEEATGTLSITRKCFRHLALDYVLQVRSRADRRRGLKTRAVG